MYDRDIYFPNQAVEDFCQQLKLKVSKDYPHMKVYISTANPYKHWTELLYRKKSGEFDWASVHRVHLETIYKCDNTELMEE